MSARLRAWFRAAPVAGAPSEAASDGDLVRLFADTRDDDAFSELVRRHGPMVLATCRRVLHPDVHTADDAFQAAFLVLATRAAAVSPPERVGAFLHGVAVLVAKKAKAWARKALSSAPADLDLVPAAPSGADPDAADVRAQIDDVLAGLPSKYRAAVVLCDLEQKSRKEAAALLGWSEGALSGRLARARALLADRLARRGVTLPAALAGAGLGVLVPASAALATVPVQLAASTIRTATLVAVGAPGAEAIPAPIAALAQGVPMHSATFKLLAATLAGVATALGGIGLYALTAADPPAPPVPAPALAAAPVPPVAPGPRELEAKHTYAHSAAVTAVASGAGLVVSGDAAGGVIVWDAKTEKQKSAMTLAQGKFSPIYRAQFLPDRTLRMVTGWTDDPQARYYLDLPFPPDSDAVQATHSNAMFGATADGAFSFGSDNDGRDLTLWPIDPDAGKKGGVTVQARFRHDHVVEHAAGTDAGTVATVAGAPGAPVLRLWSKGSNKPLWEVDLSKTVAPIDATCLRVAPGGKRIAVTGAAGQLWLFDARTGKLVTKTGPGTGAVSAAAFGPDGKQIAVGCADKTARVYDTETGKELAVLRGHADAVGAVAFGPDGKQIVTGSADKTVKVWDVSAVRADAPQPPVKAGADWATKHTFAHKKPVTALAFGPDLVAVGDKGGVLALWDAKTGRLKEEILDGTAAGATPINRIQVSADGVWLYLVTNDGDCFHQCSVEKKDRLFPGSGGSGRVVSFGATADGKHWLQADGKRLVRLLENRYAENIIPFLGVGQFPHKEDVKFAAAGDADVVATVAGGVLRRWEKGNEKPLWETKLDQFEVAGLAVCPVSKVIAVGGTGGEVRVYAALTGKVLATLKGHTGAATAIAFNADGTRIVTGSADKTARVWGAEKGKELAVLKGHAEAVTAVGFAPVGELIATGSADKTARVWEFKK